MNDKKEDCKHKLQKCYDEDGNLFAHWCYKCGEYWMDSGDEKEEKKEVYHAPCWTDDKICRELSRLYEGCESCSKYPLNNKKENSKKMIELNLQDSHIT